MRAPIFPRRRAFAELVAELEDARATAWGAQDEIARLRRERDEALASAHEWQLVADDYGAALAEARADCADLQARLAHKRRPKREPAP